MSILDKASLVMIPSGYKEDVLYSVKPRNGEGDFTFTRASTGTRVNSDGYIEEVPWNKAQYSQDFANAYWSKQCAINSNTQTSPIGSNDADEIVETTTNTYQYWYKQISLNVGIEQTFSVYVKYIDCQYFQLTAYNGGVYGSANFDLINKTYDTAASSGSYEVVSANLEELENDWMRVSMTFKSLSSTSSYIALCMNNNATAGYIPLYTGTGLKTAIWGLQWNSGSLKPYIKTTDRLNIPRLDYTGGSTTPTLLLEGQRTNIVPYTEDFSQWGAINSNRTLINNTNPIDSNAYEIESSVTSSASRIYYSAIMTAGNDYSSTYLVKPSLNSPQYLGFACISNIQPDVLYDFANDQFVDFNIVGNAAKCESISMNNGWKLLKVPVHESVINTRLNIYQGRRVGNNLYGTTGESYYIKFAQLEQGNYTTSYIPTSGTSVTRVGDVCNDAGTSATFNSTEGVLFAEIAALENDGRIALNDGTANNNVRLVYNSSLNRIEGVVYNGANQAVLNYTLPSVNSFYKIAFKYKASDFSLYVNGLEVDNQIGSGVTFPENTLSQIDFDAGNGLVPFYGKTKQLMVFNEALSDSELTTLTTI